MNDHTRATVPMLDIETVRGDFPALSQEVNGRPLVYLDSAATALKPQAVIDAVVRAYSVDVANVHRGVHTLSQRATASYEGARDDVMRFLGAERREEVIFTRGTSEAINLVAHSYAMPLLGDGDQVVISALEHHSNIVPWQMVTEATGAELVVVPLTDTGEVRLEDFASRITERTKVVACAHVSNALGTVLPILEIGALAHAVGAVFVVDGAQAVPHLAVDVAALGVDFYAFSGHKLYGPSGIGVLYGREALLEAMPPYQGGGDMIDRVTFAESTWNDLPYKFEAGTPNIAGAIGLGAAVRYVDAMGLDSADAHERLLLEYGTRALTEVPGLKLVGTAPNKLAVLSFVMDCAHPSDIGEIVDQHGVAIRTGHHCAQPVMDRFGVPATARASLAVYNTRADIDALVVGLLGVRKLLA